MIFDVSYSIQNSNDTHFNLQELQHCTDIEVM